MILLYKRCDGVSLWKGVVEGNNIFSMDVLGLSKREAYSGKGFRGAII